MVCGLVYLFRVVKPTPEACLSLNGEAINHQKMYDNFHTAPWMATWYQTCGIPKDGAWSLPITSQATNNSGQFTVRDFGEVDLGME